MDPAEKARIKEELQKLYSAKKKPPPGVNMYLLMIIVAVLVAMVIATFYFLWRYGQQVDKNAAFAADKSSLQSDLGQCNTELANARDEMLAMSEELNISSASRSSLSQLYVNLSDVSSQLESDLTNTRSTLSSCRLDLKDSSDRLEEAIEERDDYMEQYEQKAADFTAAMTEVERLRKDLSESKKQVSSLTAELLSLQACVEKNNCTICED